MHDDPSTALTGRLARLSSRRRDLRRCATVGQLFARAAEIARTDGGFARAVVLSVWGTTLEAGTSDPLADHASDLLRRATLREPVRIAAGTVEAELLRNPTGAVVGAATSVGPRLGLQEHLVVPIAPEGTLLAVLVADRAAPAVTDADMASAVMIAWLLELAIERHVLRSRTDELDCELRQLAGSAQALVQEVLKAPLVLPRDRGHGPAFPRVDIAAPVSADTLRTLLTEREMHIASLLTQGLTNQEIGDRLIVSAETVKASVPRILQKLGAKNRVHAAAIVSRLTAA